MKTTLFKLPEYYLMILMILAGYSPSFYINPIFIGILVLLIIQNIFKNKISGLLLGIIFFLFNLLYLGALLSEFNEFTEYNSSAKELLFVGLSIWTLNLLMSITMIYKYATNSFENGSKLGLEKQNI